MKKLITLLFMLLSILALLTGCQKEKAETEVLEEIEALFISDYAELTFDEISVELEKRQTDIEAKVDYVWAVIRAENNDISLKCKCELTYVLYNEGWELEEKDYSEASYQLKRSTVTEQDALKQIEGQGKKYDEIELVKRDTELSVGLDIFIYHGQYRNGYVTVMDEIQIEFKHSLYKNWIFENISVREYDKEWAVYGKWEYNHDDDNMWIIIHEINNDEIVVEYDFNYSDYFPDGFNMKKKVKNFTSNGKVTRTFHSNNERLWFNIVDPSIENGYAPPDVYITNDKGVSFEGVAVYNDYDEYVFEYVDN